MTESALITLEQARALLGVRTSLVLGQDLSTKLDGEAIRRDVAKLAIDACTDEIVRAKLESTNTPELLDIFASTEPSGYSRFRQQATRYLAELAPNETI